MPQDMHEKQYVQLSNKMDSIHSDLDKIKIDVAIIKSDGATTKEHSIKTNGRVTRMEEHANKLAMDQVKTEVHFENHVKEDERHQKKVEKYFYWFVTSIVGTFGLLLYNTITNTL